MLSRRVIAYYGLIRASESLPATYGFAAGSAAPKEIGFRWESRGSPIYSAGLCSRAASLTPVAPKGANDCCFPFGISLHLQVTGSATTLVVSRLQSSLRADFALMLRPASWLALLSRTFTFELSLAGSPRANVEYNYVDKQSIPTTGLSPASPTALWAAELGLTPWILEGRGHLARSTRCPAPSRQGEPLDFSRQVITHTLRSSRSGPPRGSASGCAGRLPRKTNSW
jgi:hypothetical protein